MTIVGGELDIYRDGRLGIVALNRPGAINALSLGMVEGIAEALRDWRDDADIRAVVFEGRGPRGFCSGGDVRAVREAVIAGRPEEADAFFAAEYRMNALIATYPKPAIAIAHGVVMGGGIGVAGHCAFRFCTADARFAMPEAAIGFFTDVGVNFILARAPVQRALLFAMAGLPVEPADALALGLADCVVPAERLDALRLAIGAAAEAGSMETALVEAMPRFGVEPGEAGLCRAADRLPPVDWSDAGAIVSAARASAEDDPPLGILADALEQRSPTSLAAIVLAHERARRVATVGEVLAADLELARLLCRLPDFAEGVRAQLVDKDRRPNWQPAASVPHQEISAALQRAAGLSIS